MAVGDEWPLVGRAGVLAEIADVLADPDASGVVLVGSGGVGKTRLARHVVRAAEGAGFATATALATRAGSTIPFGALESIIGEAVGTGSVTVLRAARRSLLERAGGAPLVLFVDDAHLLDPASATLVLRLAEDQGVFVLATVRSGEDVPDPVTALWKDAGARRIDLQPLGHEDTEALLSAVARGPLSPAAVGELASLGRGNPLALCELVTAAKRSGALRLHDGRWSLRGALPISDRLIDLVELRLTDASPEEREALAVVALADPLPVSLLEQLVEVEVLESLERRGLVTVRSDDDVTVGHPIYGEVAVRSVGEMRRRALLASLADATAEHARPSIATSLRVAIWRHQSGRDITPEVLLEGAQAAYRLNDHHTTAELAGAAWHHTPSAEAGHLRGFALGRLARPAEADEVLVAASDLVADDRLRVLVALAHSENRFRGLNDPDGAIRIVVDAEAAVDDRVWRDELVAHRAMLVMQTGKVDDALRLVEPLLADDAPERPFIKAAYTAGPGLANDGQTERAAELAQRALPVHERVWEEDLFQTEPAVHHVTAMVALVESGQLVEAQQYADLAVHVAAESGESYGLAYMLMLAGLVALRRGQVVTARQRCLDAAPLFRAAGYPSPLRWVSAGQATAAALAGDVTGARDALAVVDELAGDTPVRFNEAVVDEARGWLRIAEGDFEAGRSVLLEGADHARRRGERATAAHLLHTVARVGGSAEVVDDLAELAQVLDGDLIGLRLAHARALAGSDGERLDEVAEEFDALGADLLAAEAAAEAVRAHRRAGDARRATRSSRRAHDFASACEGALTPAMTITDSVDPLTDREREIALLAAEGAPSKEIAERLVVSRRTVDNHLQRVFAKLGISRRADLPEALGRGRP